MCTKSGELAGQAVDLKVVISIMLYIHIKPLQEDIPQLPALSRIPNIALRRSRVLGVSADHLARGPTRLGAAYACGLPMLKVEPLSVMCVWSLWLKERSRKAFVFVVVEIESDRSEGF